MKEKNKVALFIRIFSALMYIIETKKEEEEELCVCQANEKN
jgi:hypothetical protein